MKVYVEMTMVVPVEVNETDPGEAEAYVEQLLDEGEFENIYEEEIRGTFEEDMLSGFGHRTIIKELTGV